MLGIKEYLIITLISASVYLILTLVVGLVIWFKFIKNNLAKGKKIQEELFEKLKGDLTSGSKKTFEENKKNLEENIKKNGGNIDIKKIEDILKNLKP